MSGGTRSEQGKRSTTAGALRRWVSAGVAGCAVVAIGVALAAPAQAAPRLWWSHGATFSLCQADLKRSASSLASQGWRIVTVNQCAPNPYVSGAWRGSFTYTR